MNVEFRRASPEDARLLAETRRRAWDTTYRGIYPDAMIDEYDLEAHTARDAARIADPANAVFLHGRGGMRGLFYIRTLHLRTL